MKLGDKLVCPWRIWWDHWSSFVQKLAMDEEIAGLTSTMMLNDNWGSVCVACDVVMISNHLGWEMAASCVVSWVQFFLSWLLIILLWENTSTALFFESVLYMISKAQPKSLNNHFCHPEWKCTNSKDVWGFFGRCELGTSFEARLPMLYDKNQG